jgi:putative ABC transport system permease protein
VSGAEGNARANIAPSGAALRLGWRFLKRDLRAGEVRVLLASLMLAVMAVTAVGFLTDRAERALALEANRLLGGDAMLRADEPIGAAPRERAQALGLRQTETAAFPSMLRAGEALRLSDVRAIGDEFPLRGSFRLADAQGTARDQVGAPERGTAWLSRGGAQLLGANVGDTVRLGEAEFQLAALVLQEPDSALDYFNVAPRVFLHWDDLPATGLVQEGSRITWRLIVAGDAAAAQQWVDATRAALDRGQRLETIEDARPEVRRALERADRFLGLAALVAVVLAAVAVAMAARRHSARHLDGCAVLRCLGASQSTLAGIYASELLILGLAGSALGVLAGFTVQAALGGWLETVLGIGIPAAGPMPAIEGFAVGLLVLLTFALPPVLALRRVPALRVLRRDLGAVEPSAVIVALAGIAGLAALLWWKAGSATLGFTMLGGIAGTLLVLALLAYVLVVVLRRVRTRLRGPWRYGLANLGRRPLASVVQVSALGLGLMAILLLTLVRTDLLGRWQDSLPQDAPNRFVMNVQTDQVDAARAIMAQHAQGEPMLVPMIRGRLVGHNDAAVSGEDYAARGERAKRLAEREFNLSWAASLQDDNRIVAGTFWPADGAAAPEISVEEGLAETLGWKLGDRVAFDIAGQRFEARVTSLRHVEWESFKPNFFVLASPGALDGYAASWITAVRVPRGDVAFTDALVRAFPNVSVVDVDAVIDQVRNTADQVASAVEYVFYFTLVAGLLVLAAAVSSTQDERLLEGGVMRVVGASRRQLRFAHAAEFAALGLIAGLTAAVAAGTLSGVIATQVFEADWAPDWRLALMGGGIGVVAVTLTGLLATRRVAAAPPSQTLRALQG